MVRDLLHYERREHRHNRSPSHAGQGRVSFYFRSAELCRVGPGNWGEGNAFSEHKETDYHEAQDAHLKNGGDPKDNI